MLLADQDRSQWDRELIAEGQALVRPCLRRDQPGPYQIQAAINAVHSDAPDAAATDWAQIVALYDQLLAVAPSPVVALNRAVAVAEVDGPAAGAGPGRRARPGQLLPVPRHPRPTCSGSSAATATAAAAYQDGARPGRQRGRARFPPRPAAGAQPRR